MNESKKNMSKTTAAIIIAVITGCVIMALTETLWQPEYFLKSVTKEAVFGLCIAAAYIFGSVRGFKDIFKVRNPKSLAFSMLFGVIVYAAILALYFILRNYIDLMAITDNLTAKENINASNFLYAAIYISVINSFLEELFFRGFAFLILKRSAARKYAYIFSASAFALYHIFIMNSWFSAGMFILLLVLLFASGIVLDYFDRHGSLYDSWIIHMSANLGINTIGLIMFGLV